MIEERKENSNEEATVEPAEEKSEKTFQNWCPNCKTNTAVEIIEHKGAGKVRVKCTECGREWECFL